MSPMVLWLDCIKWVELSYDDPEHVAEDMDCAIRATCHGSIGGFELTGVRVLLNLEEQRLLRLLEDSLSKRILLEAANELTP